MSDLDNNQEPAGKSRSDSLMTALGSLREVNDPGTLSTADLVTAQTAVDTALDPAEPVPLQYTKMRNSTWRILEEQRAHATEIAEECDGAIRLLLVKRDDALAVVAACEQTQRGLEQA